MVGVLGKREQAGRKKGRRPLPCVRPIAWVTADTVNMVRGGQGSARWGG